MKYTEPVWLEITPDLAREMLLTNTANRRIRPTWVMYLAAQIKQNNWIPTTDAIGFRADGVLCNGQHRLLAVITAKQPAMMLVVGNISPDAFPVTDRGLGRTLSDALELPSGLIADGNLIAHILNLKVGNRTSEHTLRDVIDWWMPAWLATTEATGNRHVSGFGSTPIRLGFGVRWASGARVSDRLYVLEQYAAMIQNNTASMSRATAALWKRVLRDKFGSGDRDRRVFGAAVVYHYMDPARATTEPVVKHPTETQNEMKAWLGAMAEALSVEGEHPYQFATRIKVARPITAKKLVTHDDLFA